jgi:hypothetical protein
MPATAGALSVTGGIEVKTGTLGKVVLTADAENTTAAVLVLKTDANHGKLTVDSSTTGTNARSFGTTTSLVITSDAGGTSDKQRRKSDQTIIW